MLLGLDVLLINSRLLETLPPVDRGLKWLSEFETVEISCNAGITIKDSTKGFLEQWTLNNNALNFKLLPCVLTNRVRTRRVN